MTYVVQIQQRLDARAKAIAAVVRDDDDVDCGPGERSAMRLERFPARVDERPVVEPRITSFLPREILAQRGERDSR